MTCTCIIVYIQIVALWLKHELHELSQFKKWLKIAFYTWSGGAEGANILKKKLDTESKKGSILNW